VPGGSVCILGLGAVGARLAAELERAGLPVARWKRSHASHAEPADASRGDDTLARAIEGSRALVFCVPDRAIQPLAADVARVLGQARPTVALHTSGFHGPELLDPLARAGLSIGVMHPLAALSKLDAGAEHADASLRGAWFALSGSESARQTARELVRALDGRELELGDQPGDPALYHAAAALLSNGAVALFDAALELAVRATRDPDQARAAFASLLASTARNLAAHSVGDAQTGPVVRGDIEVVAGHLARIEAAEGASGAPGAMRELYRLASLRLVALAERSGRLAPADAARLRRILEC
jgi:predicted short-subunit dehydrogenase-like oxidoreductase (DUF2520 family)